MRLTRRALAGLAAASGASLALGRAASAAQVFDPSPYVNPQLRSLIPHLLPLTKTPLSQATLAKARSASSRAPLAAPSFVEQVIQVGGQAPPVRLYVVNAKGDGDARPAILHMHGGGFVTGSAYAALRGVQEVAAALDCVVVTVDYRLAPETKFPGALEDNYAALKWLYAKAPDLGVDRSRIAVMSESAGGGHAAMLAIAARDRGEIPLAYQALIYPMLDDRTASSRRAPPYQGALMWTPENNRFGWSSLLGAPAGARRVPYGAVPARVDNLRGLPPTYIGVGSIDLFVDEDIAYARRLINAGVAVTLNVAPGAFHGFDMIPGPLARAFRASALTALEAAFQLAP